MDRPWTDEHEPRDAPIWMTAEEAAAWASGWNAAVDAYIKERRRLLDEARTQLATREQRRRERAARSAEQG